MSKHTPGQEVYSIDGRVASYITSHAGLHIVLPLFEGEDGEIYSEHTETWPEVFAAPPVERVDQTVAALQEKANALRLEINRLSAQRREEEQREKDAISRLSKIKALERIEQHLDGKFTLFVTCSSFGVPGIKPAAELLEDRDRYTKSRLRLLSLFGQSNGDFQWRINRYSDDSGDWADVYPCETEDEARAIIRELYAQQVADWRAGKHSSGAVSWPKAIAWLEMPEDVAARDREVRTNLLREQERKALERLEAVRTDLAALSRTEAPQ